jgi:flagellin-like hook-associated protein FlgL
MEDRKYTNMEPPKDKSTAETTETKENNKELLRLLAARETYIHNTLSDLNARLNEIHRERSDLGVLIQEAERELEYISNLQIRLERGEEYAKKPHHNRSTLYYHRVGAGG